MSDVTYDVNNSMIQLVMVLKMQQIQRQEMPSLQYDDLEDYLNRGLWRRRTPESLSQACDQVMSVNANDIIRFLSFQAIKDGSRQGLCDYADLLGGN